MQKSPNLDITTCTTKPHYRCGWSEAWLRRQNIRKTSYSPAANWKENIKIKPQEQRNWTKLNYLTWGKIIFGTLFLALMLRNHLSSPSSRNTALGFNTNV